MKRNHPLDGKFMPTISADVAVRPHEVEQNVSGTWRPRNYQAAQLRLGIPESADDWYDHFDASAAWLMERSEEVWTVAFLLAFIVALGLLEGWR